MFLVYVLFHAIVQQFNRILDGWLVDSMSCGLQYTKV